MRASHGEAGRLPTDQIGWLLASVGVGLVLIVVSDGSLTARLGRSALVAALTVAAPLRRERRPWPVELAAGLVGVVIGLAFGLRYTAFAGLVWRAVVGWVELAAGLALVGIGLRHVGRGRRFLVAAPLRAATLIGAAVIVLVTTPPVMAVNVPPVAIRTPTPADAGLDAEAVRFVADDGVELAGWYIPSRDGTAVIVRHAAGRSTTASVIEHARVLAEHGFGVLITDARSHGASEGRAMDFGWYGERDIAAAVSHLVERDDVDAGRIAVVGLSMGGEEAIGAIGADPRIAAVVAEGATARTAGDKAWMTDVHGWRGWLQRSLDVVSFGLADLLTDAPHPETLAAAARDAAPRPILLIAAGDVADEVEAADHIARQARGNVQTWVVPAAGHTRGLATEADEWEARVVAFLDGALRSHDRPTS